MHLNQWRKCLAYDLGGPVYLRRRFLKCQKANCKVEPKTMTVREEGLECYPFLHTLKRAFIKRSSDRVIEACVNGTLLSKIRQDIMETQRQEWLSKKQEFQMNFNLTHPEPEHRAIFLGQAIPYPEFTKFVDYLYVPCRAIIKGIILQHWERCKHFYFWHMAMTGADKCSADMTFKRAKFIVTTQGKHFAPPWKGVYQILNEAGMVISWAFTRTQATKVSQVCRRNNGVSFLHLLFSFNIV